MYVPGREEKQNLQETVLGVLFKMLSAFSPHLVFQRWMLPGSWAPLSLISSLQMSLQPFHFHWLTVVPFLPLSLPAPHLGARDKETKMCVCVLVYYVCIRVFFLMFSANGSQVPAWEKNRPQSLILKATLLKRSGRF